MYNRYIRNDQGTYTRIPEEEPRHTQGGTSPSGQPEHPPSGTLGKTLCDCAPNTTCRWCPVPDAVR